MDYETLIKHFNELNAQIENARATMSQAAQPLIEAATQRLFKICPEIDSVFWTQYTPYFNDGDSCYFSVGELCFVLVGDTHADEYDGSYLYDSSDLEYAKKRLQEATEFEADPTAWRIKKMEEYRAQSGRDYPHNPSSLGVYESSERAREQLNIVESFFARYSAEAVERLNTSYKAISTSLSTIPEEIMRAIYGDHALVRIDRNGTTVEEYSHE